jgi:hypothetical protein
MMKKYTFWLYGATIFQILGAMLHSLSFIMVPKPSNDTEKEMLHLMTTFKMDLGAGFSHSMQDLVTALSICFPLLLLLGGIVNWYLLRKNASVEIMRGYILINLIIFGVCFLSMAFLTFLPPITLTGLVFLCLLLAYITVPRKSLT